MTDTLLPVRLEPAGNRLPVLWTSMAPGGVRCPGSRTGASQALALGLVVRSRPRRPEPLALVAPPLEQSVPVPDAADESDGPVRPRPGLLLRTLSLRSALRVVSRAGVGALAVGVALVVAGALTGRWGLVPVLTGSMRPGIQPGDLVLVSPEPLAAVRPGQILDFQPPGEGGAAVVHRVVSVTRGNAGPVIRTKGDANNVADPWKAQLGGTSAWRVRAVIPKLGYLSVAEHDPYVRLSVEGVLLIGGLALGLGAIWGGRAEEKGREPSAAGVAVA